MSIEATTTVIPAQPGWEVLWMDEDTGELFVDSPVLAWAVAVIPRHGHVMEIPPQVFTDPVTVGGQHYDPDDYMRRPDGVVIQSGDEVWSSLEAANSEKACSLRLSIQAQR